MTEIEQFYQTTSKKQPKASKNSMTVKDKDKEKHIPSIKKQQQDASRREAVAAKRMQELMRQFGTILRQVMVIIIMLRYHYIDFVCHFLFFYLTLNCFFFSFLF